MATADFSDTLAIKLTRFFMRFAGFWISKDSRGETIMRLAMFYTIGAIWFAFVITGTDMWFSRSRFNDLAYAACNCMTTVVILLKLTVFTIRRDAFLNLIKFCYANFWQRDYDEFGTSVLQHCEIRCTYFVCTFTVFALCTACCYMIQPILANIGKNETDRVFPFNVWIDLPLTTTPYYEMIFLTESLSTVHSGICYFCFDNLLCIMNVHLAGQFRILQRRLTRLCDGDEFDDYPARSESAPKPSANVDDSNGLSAGLSTTRSRHFGEFKECVRNHQSLIGFAKMVEDVYTFVILGQVVIFSLLICLVTYQAALAESSSLPRRAIFIIHSAGTFTQTFMFTLTCDGVIRQSKAVAEAAYSARWYFRLAKTEDRQLCKDLMFVIMRSRQPCCLTAGGFFPISLETFTTIMSTSLSYLTLLRQGND